MTGRPLAEYPRERIFAPLGMTHTNLVRSDRVSAGLATGYGLRAGGPRPVGDRDLVTVGGGSGSVLRADTLAAMFASHYQPDPRLPGVGLAFFRHEIGGHLVVEHDGLLPGFTSQLSVAPDDDLGVVAFTNGSHGARAWLSAEVGGVVRDVLGVPAPRIRTDVPHRPDLWTGLCGWYSFRGSARDVQKWFIAGAKVSVRRGRLVLHALSPVPALARGLPPYPDDAEDPYVFRIDLSGLGVGTSRVVFSRTREPAGDGVPPRLRATVVRQAEMTAHDHITYP